MTTRARGERQRQRRTLAQVDDPEQIVALIVRIPARLRSKAHAAAAALNMSTTAYVEQLLEQAPAPEAAQDPLPLAETA